MRSHADFARRSRLNSAMKGVFEAYHHPLCAEILLAEMRALRDGGLPDAEFLNTVLRRRGLELHARAIVGSAKVCWVVDLHRRAYLYEKFEDGFYSGRYLGGDDLSVLDSRLRWVNAIQASLNEGLDARKTRSVLACSNFQSCMNDMLEGPPEAPSEPSIPSYDVVVSAVVLLSLVYQYLMGNVDRGGSKAYSRSSLDFRDIYVAIDLFLGAYVWIKFREVAFKGAHPRKLPDKKGGIKVVYAARFKPPMWNGEKVARLEIGRFATPQEAHNQFLIVAFYYKRAGGLLDGWFHVPPMSEEERRLTGREKRKWVIDQAKRVYEDFEKQNVLRELLDASEDQVTPEQNELNVDLCGASLLNPAEYQQPALASQVGNSGMGMAMLNNHGGGYVSHSFDGVHEGFALPNGHGLGYQEGSALPVSQLPPNTENGMGLNGNDQLDSLRTLVHTLQQQISLLEQQFRDQKQQSSLQQQVIFDLQQQIFDLQQYTSDQQQNIQELCAQMLQFQYQPRVPLQQQLQESWIPSPQWPHQLCLQEQQQQQVINQGVPSFVVEMEQSMHQQNYPGLMASPPDEGQAWEAFF